MKFNLFYFIAFWMILNIVQGSLTELTSDEGYYWFYSGVAQWGYYDHPPLVASIIAAGNWVFKNELGVRFFNILMNGLGLFVLLKLASPYIKNQLVAFLLILSMPLLNYLSFVVFPDGPLLFFTMLFLLAYKRFLEKNDLFSSLSMAITLALMLYSKYHALLFLVFTVLSNPRLLRSKLFNLSLGTAFVLFLPHVLWQYQNGFPAFRYHLSGRMSSFSAAHVFEYISQQIVAIGPAFILVPFMYKATNQFEKTLKFIVLGTFAFFLLASFRAFIHFHWTSIVIFPLLFLSIRFYGDVNRRKLLLYSAVPFFILVGTARVHLMTPVIPLSHVNVDYYHGRKLWANDIASLACTDTVLFQDNFREASLFSFYSKKTGVTVYSGATRKSQYDLWHYEDLLQHRNLLYIRDQPFDGGREFTTGMGRKIYYTTINNLSSYFNIDVHAKCVSPKDDAGLIPVCIEIKNPRQEALSFRKDDNGNSPLLYYELLRGRTVVKRDSIIMFPDKYILLPGRTTQIPAHISVKDLKAGRYKVVFGFQFGKLKDSENEEITIRI